MYLFIVNKKEKEIQKKRNIKSRKIDKRKRKMLVFKVFHNILYTSVIYDYVTMTCNMWQMCYTISYVMLH